MKKNMSNTDRLVRVVAALILAILYFTNVITGTTGLILFVMAIVFLLTSFVGFCPIYSLFGISTCPRNKSVS